MNRASFLLYYKNFIDKLVFNICTYCSSFDGHGCGHFQHAPFSPRKAGFHPKFNLGKTDLTHNSQLLLNFSLLVLFFCVGSPTRPYAQMPMRKHDNDDDNHLRTSSISSSSVPISHPLIDQEQPLLNNPSANVKVCIVFVE